MSNNGNHLYEFGPFRVDPSQRLFSLGGDPVRIPPKTFELLLYLLEHSNEVIDKETLMLEVWHDSFVEDANLTVHISTLRKIFADDTDRSAVIENFPKKGYRFVAKVCEIANAIGSPNGGSIGTADFTSKPVVDAEQLSDAIVHVDGASLRGRSRNIRPGWRVLLIGGMCIVVAATGFFGYRYFNQVNSKQIGSIAVMPFVNESGNGDVEYLSDGLTEALIKSLSQLPNLSVKARSTVLPYKGTETSSKKIGEELNVQAVLLGRVAQHGSDLILSLELVDTKTQDVIWSEQYDRTQSDLVTLQVDIARDVSSKLRISLSGADRQKLAKTFTNNPAAYTNYLLGRFYWNKRTGDALRRSVEYYEAAIALDPDFALAYAGMADSYVLFPSYVGAQPKDAFPKAETAAKKALELDGSLAEAHAALSFAYFNYDWKFDESEEQIRQAIALDPNYSTAYHWFGNTNLLAEGRFDESIEALKTAHELDPLSVIISADLATSYLYALRFEEAISQYNKALEMDNNFYYARLNLGRTYLLKGDLEKALDELQKASGVPTDPRIPMLRSRIYSKMGRRADALKMLDELKEMQRVRYVSNCNFAVAYTGLGETDLAFASLESAFKAHDDNLVYLKTDPLLADLRGDPRYGDLLKRMGLPR